MGAGCGLLLGLLLVTAGAIKLLVPRPFSHAVYRLLEGHATRRVVARWAPFVVGPIEVTVGASLLAAGSLPASLSRAGAVAAAALYSGFVFVVVAAVRKGTSCGCWSSLSDGVAGGAEAGRSIALMVIAFVFLASELEARPTSLWRWNSTAGLALATAVLLLAIAVGSRFWRTSDGARRGVRLGRAGNAAAFVLGHVPATAGKTSLPIDGSLPDTALATVLDQMRSSETVRTFERWLGERAAAIDWNRAEGAVRISDPGGAEEDTLVSVIPPPDSSLAIEVLATLVGTDATDVMVLAVVDGEPVSVMGDSVVHLVA